ncbi:MAG: aminotransferase class V-fold PLP-dependent enzyme [Candidatus Liptonbacteria bacterium]
MKRIYLDYAATTPVDARVLRAMLPYFSEKWGNPGSLHSFGQEAIAAVDRSRETIAKIMGCPPSGGFRDVIFTGSATEANNMVLRSTILGIKNYELGIRSRGDDKHLIHNSQFIIPRIVISAVEHESVLGPARALEREGLVEPKILPVAEEGKVKLSALKKLLNENTVLVSVMQANNEVGSIQPIVEIAKMISDFKKQVVNSEGQVADNKRGDHKPSAIGPWPVFHTDFVQALQYLDCRPEALGVDFMTISGHKIYGPKGIGGGVFGGGGKTPPPGEKKKNPIV